MAIWTDSAYHSQSTVAVRTKGQSGKPFSETQQRTNQKRNRFAWNVEIGQETTNYQRKMGIIRRPNRPS